LTAITAKLLNAIGAYRIPQEHLSIYFVFTNELTQEQYEGLKDKYVECETHGTSRVAFVCQHLLKGSSLGFHETFDSSSLISNPKMTIKHGVMIAKRLGNKRVTGLKTSKLL
jgi:hypothetical protein